MGNSNSHIVDGKPASGSNIYMDNRSLILKGESCGKSYNFFFDTGNGLAALSHNFYESNKTEIDAKVNVLGDLRAELVL